jgi:hypothetical protein
MLRSASRSEEGRKFEHGLHTIWLEAHGLKQNAHQTKATLVSADVELDIIWTTSALWGNAGESNGIVATKGLALCKRHQCLLLNLAECTVGEQRQSEAGCFSSHVVVRRCALKHKKLRWCAGPGPPYGSLKSLVMPEGHCGKLLKQTETSLTACGHAIRNPPSLRLSMAGFRTIGS